jgi:hypothetical protein
MSVRYAAVYEWVENMPSYMLDAEGRHVSEQQPTRKRSCAEVFDSLDCALVYLTNIRQTHEATAANGLSLSHSTRADQSFRLYELGDEIAIEMREIAIPQRDINKKRYAVTARPDTVAGGM